MVVSCCVDKIANPTLLFKGMQVFDGRKLGQFNA